MTLAETLAKARADGDVVLKPPQFLTPAYEMGPPYRVAILHLLMQKRILLRDPVGTGKTACALGAYAYFCQTNPDRRDRLVVLTTQSAQLQWRDEARRLTTRSAEAYRFDGRKELKGPARTERFLDTDTDIWVMTYATAASDLPTLLQRPYLIVFDEIQIARGARQSVIHPACVQLSTAGHAAWGLSATPLMNKLENLHGIYDVLVPGLLGNEFQFAHRYIRTITLQRKDKATGQKVGPTFKKLIGYKNERELTERLRPFTLQRTEAQLGAFMPTVSPLRRIDVDMGPAQRALYEAYLAQLRDAKGRPTIKQKVTAVLYASMITDAPAVLGHPEVPSAKWAALKEFLTTDADGQPVLVYTFFASVARWLKTQCLAEGISADVITGTMSAPKRHDVQTAFQAGQVRVVILTSAAIYGVNLRAPVFVFYDLPWVWGDMVQAIGRARRRVFAGLPGTLCVAVVLASRSVNEKVLVTLRMSQETAGRVLGALTTQQATPTTLDEQQEQKQQEEQQQKKQQQEQQQKQEKEEKKLLDQELGVLSLDLEDLDLGNDAEHSVESLWASLQDRTVPAAGPMPTITWADVPQDGVSPA